MMAIEKSKLTNKRVGTPKLYLWPMRALSIGTVDGIFCTNNVMNSLIISLDNTIEIENLTEHDSQNKLIKSRTVLLEPGSQLQLSVKNSRLFILSIISLTADREHLLASYTFEKQKTFSFMKKPDPSLSALFHRIDIENLNTVDAERLIESALNPNHLSSLPQVQESRIRSLALTMLNRPNEISTSEELAKTIGLSKYRMLHLFKSEVGMTWGNFKKICKLKAFNQAFAEYRKLTDSAHEADYSDLAHFSNSFKGISGLTPGQLYGAYEKLQIYIDPSI